METNQKVLEIKNLLVIEPPKHFLCGTEKIQYFDHLATNCLKKFEEIPEKHKSDTLLIYLKEALTKLQREEFTYNRQSALNLCQTILERNQPKVTFR